MKLPIIRFALAAVALAVLTTGALAEPLTFDIDKSHTSVTFKIRHFLTKVTGKFTDFSGTIQYDPKDLSKSGVDVTIQTASINTANDRRDNHLRSGDFFLAEEHPTITFKSTRVVPGEGDAFKIEGDLTMRGVTKPVVLDATKLGMMDLAGESGVRTIAGFEGTTTIDRKDYGILWNRMFDSGAMLGDDVEITLAIEAVRKKDAEAAKAATK